MVNNHKQTPSSTAPAWKEFEKSEMYMIRLNVFRRGKVLTIKETGNLKKT